MIAARLPFVAVALVCAVLGIYLAVSSGSEASLARANADLLAGRYAEVLAELDGLGGQAGGRATALRGYAYLATGQLRRSRTALQEAVRRDPNNWVLQRDYAIVLLRLGEREKAQARMRTALALNPRMPLPRGFEASE
ncbi:MAG TPA: tetratricopeptide repeat protein [Solirubrobacteraceae bacterium]|nr:tetratricopeptide repeat protein [Solirubrobacteraceae bacterium]